MLATIKILLIFTMRQLFFRVVNSTQSFLTNHKGVVSNSFSSNTESGCRKSRRLHPLFSINFFKLFNYATTVKQFIKSSTRYCFRYVHFTKRSLTHFTTILKRASIHLVQDSSQATQDICMFQKSQSPLSLWRGSGYRSSVYCFDYTSGKLRGLNPQLIYETDLYLPPFGGRLTPYIQ